MEETIWDIFSLFPFIYIVAIATQSRYRGLLLFTVCIILLVELCKRATISLLEKYPWLKRPEGATNCGCLNGGGDVSGAPGFPSGHMAATSFILIVMLFFMMKHGMSSWIVGVWVVLQMLLVATSRIKKKCHTLLQVIAGSVLGTVCSCIYLSLSS